MDTEGSMDVEWTTDLDIVEAAAYDLDGNKIAEARWLVTLKRNTGRIEPVVHLLETDGAGVSWPEEPPLDHVLRASECAGGYDHRDGIPGL